MATRKASKIDPIQVCAIALKSVKNKSDYHRIASANTEADLNAAWEYLPKEEQTRIHAICSKETQPDLNAIATEITECNNILQLQAVKASYGDDITRQVWKLIPVAERVRLKALCNNVQQSVEEEVPVEQQPSSDIQINSPQPISNSDSFSTKTKRTLFAISDDLEKLNELIDECGNDTQQQELINQWLEQLGDERDKKIDNYAALITEMLARADARKLGWIWQRQMKIAPNYSKTGLNGSLSRITSKPVETARYRLSLAKNGGRQPLIFKDGMSPTELPEQFQKVSIDPNTTAIREALERGEKLEFAQLGDRGTSLRIK